MRSITLLFASFLVSLGLSAQQLVTTAPAGWTPSGQGPSSSTQNGTTCNDNMLGRPYDNGNYGWHCNFCDDIAYFFNVDASTNVTISDFSMAGANFSPSGPQLVDVYTRPGTWVGNDGSLSGWTYVGTGSYNNVAVSWLGLGANIQVASGATQAFLFISDNGFGGMNISSNNANTGATADPITASNADLTIYGLDLALASDLLALGLGPSNMVGSICYSTGPSLSCSINYPNNPIDPLYAAAGANDPSVYYVGLSGSKVFVAAATGGTAPYTYQWSSTTGGTMTPFANKPNKAQLNYPTQSGDVQVIVTDANNVSCTTTVAMTIMDYTCPPEPGMLWYYQLCNTQTNISTCVHGTANMRALLQTGNYVFGTCSNPTKTNYTTGENEYLVYPNPTTGNATLQYFSATNAAAQISVVDLNGRVLLNQDVQLHEGVVEHMLDLSTLSDGFYFVQLRTENDAQVQRVQVMK